MPRIPATRIVGPDGAETYYPIIVVTIVVGAMAAQVPAIVDSGADDTLVPAAAVIPLGVDFSKLGAAPEGTGAGGNFQVRWCEGTILWGKIELMTRFKVAEPGMGLSAVLLGRGDFFKLFIPRFHWHKDPPVFDLDPVAKRSA